MIIFIAIMLSGVAIGCLFRGKKIIAWTNGIIYELTGFLLFALGLEVGGNRHIMENVVQLGVEALLLAVPATLGSVLVAKLLWFLIRENSSKMSQFLEKEATTTLKERKSTLSIIKGSALIVGFFVLGVFFAFKGIIIYDVSNSNLSIYVLCALMAAVGISVGGDTNTWLRLRSLNPYVALLPIFTIVGTSLGSALASVVLPSRSITDCLAVGAGLGYYSLSSIFITEYISAELGIVALLANVIREIATLLMAPMLVRLFGRLAAISAGGATSIDTTLPVIVQSSGKEMVAVSVFHGFVCDFSVPFMVTLWCSI